MSDVSKREPDPSATPEVVQPPRDSPDADEHNRQVLGAQVPVTPRSVRNARGRVIE